MRNEYKIAMPPAKPPTPPQLPCELTPELTSFIRDTAYRFFGGDAVVRNYGTDPNALRIHFAQAKN